MNHATLILLLLGSAAALLFVGVVLAAGLGKPTPSALNAYVSTLSAVLAANLGAVLGLSFVPGTAFSAAAWRFWTAPTTAALQIIAAYAYAGSLLLAVGFWVVAHYRGKSATNTIDELFRAAMGLLLAVVGVLLGRTS